MAPVVAGLTEVGGFTRMSLPSELVTSSVNISQGYHSTHLCAYECLINKKCHGYHHHVQTLPECSFETCLNPNQLTQDVGNGSAVYVRDDLHTFLNKFLALESVDTNTLLVKLCHMML
ncbi:hypothetical protein EB796_016863 [Bugula neritina]|uniref:Apple domain-containing protein n=1 Tax=Bugula neritina TaxID=10212 RepID=A0A7J7JGW1_BUGNE|nr:hypothetical protein EB796_016863 [Bugula neritina]